MSGDIRAKVAKRIRSLRSKQKLTQERLSELAEIDSKHIQKLEGKNPPSVTIDTLEKLATAFKIPLSRLLDFK